MFPALGIVPLVDDGCILTGKATSADESSPAPPPPILPRPLLMREPNEKSPVNPEKSGGGRALRRFGVAREITGVVSDSECVVVTVGAAVVVCVLLTPCCCVLLLVDVVVVSLEPEPAVAAVVSSI